MGGGGICSHELKITTGEKVYKEEHNMYKALRHSVFGL